MCALRCRADAAAAEVVARPPTRGRRASGWSRSRRRSLPRCCGPAVLSRLIAATARLAGRGAVVDRYAGHLDSCAARHRSARPAVLPLAALLKLSLVFPDHVPSRFSVAFALAPPGSSPATCSRPSSNRPHAPGATELAGARRRAQPPRPADPRPLRARSGAVRPAGHNCSWTTKTARRFAGRRCCTTSASCACPARSCASRASPRRRNGTLLKTHPAEGLELIRGPIADWLGDWSRAIGEHHEQFDGSGYPCGLSGTDISLRRPSGRSRRCVRRDHGGTFVQESR